MAAARTRTRLEICYERTLAAISTTTTLARAPPDPSLRFSSQLAFLHAQAYSRPTSSHVASDVSCPVARFFLRFRDYTNRPPKQKKARFPQQRTVKDQARSYYHQLPFALWIGLCLSVKSCQNTRMHAIQAREGNRWHGAIAHSAPAAFSFFSLAFNLSVFKVPCTATPCVEPP